MDTDILDQHLRDWLARRVTIRPLAIKLGMSRTKIHNLFVDRAKELGFNAAGGQGDGLWAVIQQEYLAPAKLDKMRPRDRAKVEDWAEQQLLKILSNTEGYRVYTTAQCKNRSIRDTTAKHDLAEMENSNIGTWLGWAQTEEFELPDCLPIKLRRLAIPIVHPAHSMPKRIPAPFPKFNLVTSSVIYYATTTFSRNSLAA